MMMINNVMLFHAILFSFFTLASQQHTLVNHSSIDEAKLHVSRLESSLHQLNSNLNDRDVYLSNLDTRIRDLGNARNVLESSVSTLKEGYLRAENKIAALEEEVRQLWVNLRKNNFDLHVIESKLRESEDRLKLLSSRHETMQAVVNEQWVQIQQVEQALLLGEIRLTKVQRQRRASRCTFFKYVNGLSDKYLQKGRRICNSFICAEGSALRSFLSQTSDQLQRLYFLVKEFHHKLQGNVKVEMERHELTAKFSNEEIVFVVASAMIVFPILCAWLWLSSWMHLSAN